MQLGRITFGGGGAGGGFVGKEYGVIPNGSVFKMADAKTEGKMEGKFLIEQLKIVSSRPGSFPPEAPSGGVRSARLHIGPGLGATLTMVVDCVMTRERAEEIQRGLLEWCRENGAKLSIEHEGY